MAHVTTGNRPPATEPGPGRARHAGEPSAGPPGAGRDPDASRPEAGRVGGVARARVGEGGETARPVRVLIVDDDAMVRQGLEMMLSAFDEVEVVGAISDGTEVAGAVNSFRPQVVLMDIRMPRMDGLTATAELRRRRDAPEVLVLTTFDTDEHVRRAMQVGACGFLLKHEPPEGIVRAICRAAVGEPMFTSSVLRQVMGLAAGDAEEPRRVRARAALARLSPSERNVAELISEGVTNQEIAAKLLMSTATVKAYVTRIFAKLEVTNRVQIAVLILEAR